MNWLQKQARSELPWTQTWEEFIEYHKTGDIPDGYGDDGFGYDLSHYNDRNQQNGSYSTAKYKNLIGSKVFNTPRYGEVEVEFRQSGEPVQYVKQTEPDEDGWTDILRDDQGEIVYLTDEEAQAKNLPITDQTIMMFANGLCIGHVGDSFGATELYVVKEFQGAGIGPYALKTYMETNPKAADSRLGQMTWQGIATAQKTWMMFVEDAMRQNRDIPQDVINSYNEVKQNRTENPPQRVEHHIPRYKMIKQQFGSDGMAIDPRKGFNEDLLIQMGVKFWDVEYDHVGRPQRWSSDDGSNWDNAVEFVRNLGYEEEGYRTFNLKMDYSGEHGVILPANYE